MFKTLSMALIATVTLAACGERENPLMKEDKHELAEWIYKNRTKVTDQALLELCTEAYSSGANEIIAMCNKEFAPEFADLMSNGGFSKITVEDVQLPTIWTAYSQLLKQKRIHSLDKGTKKKKRECTERGTVGFMKGVCIR